MVDHLSRHVRRLADPLSPQDRAALRAAAVGFRSYAARFDETHPGSAASELLQVAADALDALLDGSGDRAGVVLAIESAYDAVVAEFAPRVRTWPSSARKAAVDVSVLLGTTFRRFAG